MQIRVCAVVPVLNEEKFINGLEQIVIRMGKRIEELKKERNVEAIRKLEEY